MYFYRFLFAFITVILTVSTSYAMDKIDINTADIMTLKQLSGIGEKKAQAIVEYREEHGLFNDINELINVYGIGEKTVAKNKDRLTVSLSQNGAQADPTQSKYPIQWMSAKEGVIPDNAFRAGQEAKPAEQPLFICRARSESGLHLGKIRPAFGACNFGLDGKELKLNSYEVLLNQPDFTWLSAKQGDIPQGAIEAAKEQHALFICRARFQNGLHPGKISADSQGCKIGWGGKETTIFQYEVLTQAVN